MVLNFVFTRECRPHFTACGAPDRAMEFVGGSSAMRGMHILFRREACTHTPDDKNVHLDAAIYTSACLRAKLRHAGDKHTSKCSVTVL
jgi:hypothetical protein